MNLLSQPFPSLEKRMSFQKTLFKYSVKKKKKKKKLNKKIKFFKYLFFFK